MTEMLGGEFARYGVTAHIQGPGEPAMMAKAAHAPTRLSAALGTEDYHPYWSERVAEVRVDGRIVWEPVRFDIREGWVDCWERDLKWGIQTGPQVHRIHGKVTVGFALDPEDTR